MSQFVDECSLNVRGGDGGAGAVSFRREARVPKGGPDGGDGGDGGSIRLEADHNVASLLAFRDHPHRRAPNGNHGSGGKRHGRSAEDLVVKVPEGTTVYDFKEGHVIADLVSHGDRWLAAQSGIGGRGNARFLSNRRRAPSFAEQGEEGEERWIRLELRLMADIALVGFPNAGKSTLISSISAARPKIDSYPFTTLEPNLGVVHSDDDGPDFIVADVPGLIAGASEGKGLGHRFLRHLERARALVILLDLCEESQRPANEQLLILEEELKAYKPELLNRPRLVIGSRADIASSDSDSDFSGERISAVTGQGISNLVHNMRDLVVTAREVVPSRSPVILHRPEAVDIAIEVSENGVWEVINRKVVRLANLNDLTNPDSLAYLQEQFRKLGVDRALKKAGVQSGDSVKIGKLEFEYEED